MKLPNFNFVDAASVRRAVVDAGDIRADIEFQNDINGILARLDERIPPIEALGWLQQPVTAPPPRAPRPIAERGFQIIPGGAARTKAAEPTHRPATAVARSA